MTEQSIATNLVIISIALLAVTTVLTSPAWRGTLRYIRLIEQGLISNESKAVIRRTSPWLLFLSIAIPFAAMIEGIFGVAVMLLIADIIVIVTIAICVIAPIIAVVLFLFKPDIRNRIKNINWKMEANNGDWQAIGGFMHLFALWNFVLTIGLLTVCLISALDTAIGVNSIYYNQKDFEVAPWMLRASVTSFYLGLFSLAIARFAYLMDSPTHSQKGERSQYNGSVESDQAE